MFFWLSRSHESCVYGECSDAREYSTPLAHLRTLYERLESPLRWISSSKGNRMPIRVFHAALVVSGMELPVEEVECLLANQIYKGFMKGYISHEKQTVVLSKVNPFPKLTERASPFAAM